MIITPNTTGLILAALLAGFGWAQMSGAAEAFFHDNLKFLGHERHFKRYMANVVITNYVSRAIAFAISGILFSIHPTIPYGILFIVTALGAALTLAMPEHPYTRSESATDLEHIKHALRVFWHTPHLFGVALLIFFAEVTAEQLWFSFQPLLSLAGAGPLYSGFTYAIASGGSVLGAYFAKWLLKKHREDLVLALALSCFGSGALLFAFTTTPLEVTVAQIISCVGFGALWSGSSGTLNAHLPSSHRAVCLSILSACGTAAVGIMGCFVGYIFETFNRALLPMTVAFVCACLAPCLYLSVARLRASAPQE
jgi:MFS family permease